MLTLRGPFSVVDELLVTALRNELRDGAARRAEFDGNDPGVADHLTPEALELRPVALEIVHFDREVVNAGSFARRPGFSRLGAVVILYECEVERTIGEMARQVIARLARLDFTKSEHRLIELGGFLQILDF